MPWLIEQLQLLLLLLVVAASLFLVYIVVLQVFSKLYMFEVGGKFGSLSDVTVFRPHVTMSVMCKAEF